MIENELICLDKLEKCDWIFSDIQQINTTNKYFSITPLYITTAEMEKLKTLLPPYLYL